MGAGVLQHIHTLLHVHQGKNHIAASEAKNVEIERKCKEKIKIRITIVNYKYDACFVLHHILLILIFRENVSALCKVFFAYSFSCCIILIACLCMRAFLLLLYCYCYYSADADVIIMVALVLQNNDSI